MPATAAAPRLLLLFVGASWAQLLMPQGLPPPEGLPAPPPPPPPPSVSSAGPLCSISADAMDCSCASYSTVVGVKKSTMKGIDNAATMKIRGCGKVELELDGLEMLRQLEVSGVEKADFMAPVPKQLQHLRLTNVSELTLWGPVFENSSLETVVLDSVHSKTLPSAAFANLEKLKNATFKGVHFEAVDWKGLHLEMGPNSYVTIQDSQILGVQQGGWVVKNVTNFVMRQTKLKAAEVDAFEMRATETLDISDCLVDCEGALSLSVADGGRFRLVNTIVQHANLIDITEKLMSSNASLDLHDNVFPCQCDPGTVLTVVLMMDNPSTREKLSQNWCDDKLCGKKVPLTTLATCSNDTLPRAACGQDPAVPGGSATTTVGAGRSVTKAPSAAEWPASDVPVGGATTPVAAGRSLTQAPSATMKPTSAAHAVSLTSAILLVVTALAMST